MPLVSLTLGLAGHLVFSRSIVVKSDDGLVPSGRLHQPKREVGPESSCSVVANDCGEVGNHSM